MNSRSGAFICHSHEDRAYVQRLHDHLAPYVRKHKQMDVWDATRIQPGDEREGETKRAINRAKIAILLVSADFMKSDIIAQNELPPLLDAAKREELRIVPVILSSSNFENSELARYQPFNDPSFPLARMSREKREEVWAMLAKYIAAEILAVEISVLDPLDKAEKAKIQWPRRKVLLIGGAFFIGSSIAWWAVSHNQHNTNTMMQSPATSQSTPVASSASTYALIYRGHSQSVQGISWSPDGKWIASASKDHTVQIWNANSGDTHRTYRGHTEAVWTVAWSPDGTQVASASSDHVMQIWNGRSEGDSHQTYRGHTEAVWAVVWSPDGTRIASASGDHTVKIWDTSSEDHLLITYKGHADSVQGIAWSPDGTRIASASGDHTVQIWDARVGGSPQLIYKGHTSTVYAVAWSPDGTWIASGSEDGTVQIWDVRVAGNPQFIYRGHTSTIYAIAWEPAGRQMASASSDKTVQVWDVNSGMHPLLTYTGHSDVVTGVNWSPDGKRLASASKDGTVQVWNA